MVYEKLKEAVKAEAEKKITEMSLKIDDSTSDALRCNSTSTRWTQYQCGEITREKAAEYTKKRYEKEVYKDLQKDLETIEACEGAEFPETISVIVEWKKSNIWGSNPHAEVADDKRRYFGTASGCGYDKQSAAIANCFNQSAQIKKILYSKKEEALQAGETGSNHEVIGYGSGYGVLPAFESGVGMSCFVKILQEAGYKYKYSGTGKIDSYFFYK